MYNSKLKSMLVAALLTTNSAYSHSEKSSQPASQPASQPKKHSLNLRNRLIAGISVVGISTVAIIGGIIKKRSDNIKLENIFHELMITLKEASKIKSSVSKASELYKNIIQKELLKMFEDDNLSTTFVKSRRQDFLKNLSDLAKEETGESPLVTQNNIDKCKRFFECFLKHMNSMNPKKYEGLPEIGNEKNYLNGNEEEIIVGKNTINQMCEGLEISLEQMFKMRPRDIYVALSKKKKAE